MVAAAVIGAIAVVKVVGLQMGRSISTVEYGGGSSCMQPGT